jgi:hypothetical protein
MSDLDRYLLHTEVPEVISRRHWVSLTRVTLIFLGALSFSLFVLTFLSRAAVFESIGVLGVLASAAWYAWMVGDWYVERFVITDKRVLLITGLLTKRVAIMPLSKVTDLTFERSLMGRLLGYGMFVMESAGQHQALSRIGYLPSPDALYHQVSMLLFGPDTVRPQDRSSARGADYRAPGRDSGSGSRPPAGLAPPRHPAMSDQSTKPIPRL